MSQYGCLLLMLGASVLAHAERPEFLLHVPRVKAAVSSFLRLPGSAIHWTEIRPPDGPVNWYHPIHFCLPDPPTASKYDDARRIDVQVDPDSYYVTSFRWRTRWPEESNPTGEIVNLAAARRIAARFVRARWGDRMQRMRLGDQGSSNAGHNPELKTFQWEEWDGEIRTGTRISVSVNCYAPALVYSYFAHVSRPWPRTALHVSREAALAAAKAASLRLGLEGPTARSCTPYLSSQWVERPHWEVVIDYSNRHGGFLHQVFIDGATGKPVRPRG